MVLNGSEEDLERQRVAMEERRRQAKSAKVRATKHLFCAMKAVGGGGGGVETRNEATVGSPIPHCPVATRAGGISRM